MPNYICHGCRSNTTTAFQCPQCDKILCSSCGGSGSCKDKKNGQAGCNGYYKRLP